MYTAIFLMTASNTVTMDEKRSTHQEVIHIQRTTSLNNIIITTQIDPQNSFCIFIPTKYINPLRLSDQDIRDAVKERAIPQVVSLIARHSDRSGTDKLTTAELKNVGEIMCRSIQSAHFAKTR